MVLAFVVEYMLTGRYVLELRESQRTVLSGQNVFNSLHCMVMASKSDSTTRCMR